MQPYLDQLRNLSEIGQIDFEIIGPTEIVKK